MDCTIKGRKKLIKIGNSLALIVNQVFYDDTDLKKGDIVEFTIIKKDVEQKRKQ